MSYSLIIGVTWLQISPVHIISILEGEEGSMDLLDEDIIRTSHAAVREKGWASSASEHSSLHTGI